MGCREEDLRASYGRGRRLIKKYKGLAFSQPFFSKGRKMKKYGYVIWDFNGTLLDDVETGIWAVNTLLEERGLATIESIEHYRRVFRFPIIEYYRGLGFDFERESYEEIAPKWVALYLDRVKSAKLYDDVVDSLKAIKEKGIIQTVLSATERGMLIRQLDDLGIRAYFDETLGLDNIHAGSKLSLAYDWRERHSDANVLLIGDTDHDVETANALGADCALVCRGHQSREHLLSTGAKVYNSLEELLSMIEGL